MNPIQLPHFQGQVVLLTGAWGGLGRNFARHLLASGARLILSDLRQQPLSQLAEGGGLPAGWERQVLAQVEVDLGTPDGPRLLHEACGRIAAVDIVVHNAGLGFLGRFEDVPLQRMHLQLDVMLQAPMALTHHFLPDFVRRGSGQFVFIDSVAGFVATSLGASYSAAKFGLRGFAMALSGELRGRGVDVTIVYPFFTRTAILKAPVHGSARMPVMPPFFIDEPDAVIRTALKGVARRRLHVRTGFYARLMWHAVRFWPIVSSQMQPRQM